MSNKAAKQQIVETEVVKRGEICALCMVDVSTKGGVARHWHHIVLDRLNQAACGICFAVDKYKEISQLVTQNHTATKLRAELTKCVLLCEGCHRKVHGHI